MTDSRRSLKSQIDELARLTGAPESLVDEIRDIFARRGVPLDADSLPYLDILEETFTRAAALDRDSASARTGLEQGEESCRRLADSCLELYGQLHSMEEFLSAGSRLTPQDASRVRRQARERAAARRAGRGPDRPFFVILTPSEPE